MAQVEFEHPALDQIAATPEILRLALAGVTEEQTLRKPAPGRWSIAEILEHLSHVEGHSFRAGIDAALTGGELEFYDQEAYDALGTYSGREPEESFAHWEEQRESNVEFLRGFLDAGELRRSARHPSLGPVTIEDMLNEWAIHDLGHVRQILEIVRAVVFYPKLGPFQVQYSVKP